MTSWRGLLTLCATAAALVACGDNGNVSDASGGGRGDGGGGGTYAATFTLPGQ